MRKLGVFIWFGYRIPIKERVRLIRETGFETVLHWWDNSFLEEEGLSREAQAEVIRREGLAIENAHLQIDRVNQLWLDTLDGQSVFDGYLADLDGLAEAGIPTAVMHTTSGENPPPVSAVGMRRFQALAERAEKRGVRLALENVRFPPVLNQLLDAIESPMLGLCYDSGHDLVWSETPYQLLEQYQSRLFAVHLHDNLGDKDDHLPPGEGRLNWDLVRAGIEHSSYTGSFTLESDSAEIPPSRTPREHLRRHYEGAVSKLLGK